MGIALREYFGQNLTKEQQKERYEHRLDNKLEDSAIEYEERVDDVRGNDYDADIYQVVGNQDGSQQRIDVVQQREYGAVARVGFHAHILQVTRSEREEGHLRA